METLKSSTFDSHNPVDGTVIASYPNTSSADVNAAVARATLPKKAKKRAEPDDTSNVRVVHTITKKRNKLK